MFISERQVSTPKNDVLLFHCFHDESNWITWVLVWNCYIELCSVTLSECSPQVCKCFRKTERGLSGLLPRSLWPLGWWGGRSLVPRRCTPPHVRAPAAQPCSLWRPRPTRALFGRWSSWQSVCRPGWAAPYGPTPCGLWRSSHSSWCTENSKRVIMLSEWIWSTKQNIMRKNHSGLWRVRTQLPPPTFLWFCPLRQKRCDLHWAWWLQTKHCGRVLENRKDKNKILVRAKKHYKTFWTQINIWSLCKM